MVRASAAAAAPSSQQSLSHWMSKGKLVQKGQSTDAMLKRLKVRLSLCSRAEKSFQELTTSTRAASANAIEQHGTGEGKHQRA